MTNSQSAKPIGVSYSKALATAQRAAAGVLRGPRLHAVLVDVNARREVVGLTFWFHVDRRTWFGRRELWACWVTVDASGPKIGPSHDVTQLARRGLLNPPLDREALWLEPAQVMDRLASGCDAAAWQRAAIQLSLTVHEGQAVWCAIEESADAGIRTTHLAASDGSVVYQKVHIAQDASAAAPPMGSDVARNAQEWLSVLRTGVDRDQVHTAMQSLRGVGLPAVPDLVRIVADVREGIGARSRAADVLGDLRARSAVPALIAALEAAPPLLRWSIAGALGRIGDVAARAVLLHLAVHDVEEVEVSPGFSVRVSDAATNALETLERSSE